MAKITAAQLNRWFWNYRDYFYKANAEWMEARFKDIAPPKAKIFREPIQYYISGYKGNGIFKTPIFHTCYPYNDVPDRLNPYEVNYSCTYDHSNLYRMRSYTYKLRNKYLRR